jgi:hypothetical protein
MKRTILFVSLALALVLVSIPLRSPSQQKPEELAQKSAETWLALVDAGKYADSWQEAASLFKGAVSRDQWVGQLASVRSPLGKVVSRTLKGAKYTKSLPHAPAGEYVILQYSTSFQNQKDAVETITPMLDKDGTWRVSGYYIH